MNDFRKGCKYQIAYRRCYEYHQKYWNIRTPEEWQAACKELVETECTVFEQALMIAIYDEIERNNK